MIPLTIDLQEGFDNDEVIICLGDQPVYAKSGVTTNWSTGLADSIPLTVAAGLLTVQVQLPRKELSAQIELDAAVYPYLACSVRVGRLYCTPAEQMFLYF